MEIGFLPHHAIFVEEHQRWIVRRSDPQHQRLIADIDKAGLVVLTRRASLKAHLAWLNRDVIRHKLAQRGMRRRDVGHSALPGDYLNDFHCDLPTLVASGRPTMGKGSSDLHVASWPCLPSDQTTRAATTGRIGQWARARPSDRETIGHTWRRGCPIR